MSEYFTKFLVVFIEDWSEVLFGLTPCRSDASDGSDIEADYEPDFGDFDVPEENQWLTAFFEDDELDGFQGTWLTESFHSRFGPAYRRAPGVKRKFPSMQSICV